jgi:carbonic anhydrase/acetyltransferase-like protein (isoleucine patch superfamily)
MKISVCLSIGSSDKSVSAQQSYSDLYLTWFCLQDATSSHQGFLSISFMNIIELQMRSHSIGDSYPLFFKFCIGVFVLGLTGVVLSRTSTVGENSVVGQGTEVGEGTSIKRSVIGRGCRIGKNVSIEGCHIWDNVTIEDDAQLKYSVVCDGATVKAGAILKPGVVLSFKVSFVSLYAFPVR